MWSGTQLLHLHPSCVSVFVPLSAATHMQGMHVEIREQPYVSVSHLPFSLRHTWSLVHCCLREADWSTDFRQFCPPPIRFEGHPRIIDVHYCAYKLLIVSSEDPNLGHQLVQQALCLLKCPPSTVCVCAHACTHLHRQVHEHMCMEARGPPWEAFCRSAFHICVSFLFFFFSLFACFLFCFVLSPISLRFSD